MNIDESIEHLVRRANEPQNLYCVSASPFGRTHKGGLLTRPPSQTHPPEPTALTGPYHERMPAIDPGGGIRPKGMSPGWACGRLRAKCPSPLPDG